MMSESSPDGLKTANSPKCRSSQGDTMRLLVRLYLQQRCLWDPHHSSYTDQGARRGALKWILKKGEAGTGHNCKHAFLTLRRGYKRLVKRADLLSPADVDGVLSRAPAWLRDLEEGTGGVRAAAEGAPAWLPDLEEGTGGVRAAADGAPATTSPAPLPATTPPAPSHAPAPPRPVVLPSRTLSEHHTPPTAQVMPVQHTEPAHQDATADLPEKWSCPLVVRVDAARGVWRNTDGSLLATSAPLSVSSPTYWTPPPDSPRLLLLRSAEDPLSSLRSSGGIGADTTRPPPLVRVGAYLYRRLWSSPPTYALVLTLAWSKELARRALSEPGVLNYVYRERHPLVLLPPPTVPHPPDCI